VDHWFDLLTKRLALAPVTRRNFLADAIKLALAVDGSSLFAYGLAQTVPQTPQRRPSIVTGGQNPQKSTPRTVQRGPCKLIQNGREWTRDFETSTVSQGKTLSIKETHLRSPGVKSTQISVSFDGKPQYQLLWHNNEFTVTLGSGIGLGDTMLMTQDGKTVTGRIAGRKIVPMPMQKRLGKLRFVDGQPAPKVKEAGGVRKMIGDAFAAARRDTKLCIEARPPIGPLAISAPKSRTPLAARYETAGAALGGSMAMLLPTSGRADALSDGAQGPLPPNGAYPASLGAAEYYGGSGPCQQCQGDCSTSLFSCISNVQNVCGDVSDNQIGYYYCSGFGEAIICGGGDCYDGCGYPGPGPCCPIPCQGSCCGPPSTCIEPNVIWGDNPCCEGGGTGCGTDFNGTSYCCRSGDTCVRTGPQDWLCCPGGQVVCKGQCCPPGWSCSNEGICCPGAQPLSCNGVCCAAGLVCVGTCCKPSDVHGGTCCAPPRIICGENCCGPFDTCCQTASGTTCCPGPCCGGSCCGSNDVCLKDGFGNIVGCCPRNQVCGYTCCPTGQQCTDPHEGTCAPCPQGQVACNAAYLNGPPNWICCASGVHCCSGQCCAPGQLCCSPSNSAQDFGCRRDCIK
jgi:hypothetical protein